MIDDDWKMMECFWLGMVARWMGTRWINSLDGRELDGWDGVKRYWL